MRLAVEKHYMIIEGAAALSIAALMKETDAWRGKRVVLVVSGKKVSLDTLKRVLSD
jgi:threonine dehydratase